MDFTAAWAANFAASLTLSLLASSPEAQHSRNIARDSRVELVVYDSSRLPGETAAVYMTGTAVEVSSDELEAACARRSLHVRERPVVRHRHGHPSGRSAGLSPLTG